MTGHLQLTAGPRDTLDRLEAALGQRLEECREDPRLLGRPVRIVVPSRSLRLHLSTELVRRRGSLAGTLVQTLHAAALEILGRAGVPGQPGELLLDLLARRGAREEPSLRDGLDSLRDGYRSVVSSVRDLLDAGFEAGHAGAMHERLSEARLGKRELERAHGVVRVAERVASQLEERGSLAGGRMLAQATEALRRDFEAFFPARALFVVGFADATGRAADFLERLLVAGDATVLVDRPFDPADGQPVEAYTQRLVDRLGGAAAPERFHGDATFTFLRAPGPEAEVRAVAARLRASLDRGTPPERLGVVARDLEPYRAALTTQFGRLGLPFSSPKGRAHGDGATRRLAALVELLRRAGRAPTDRWLDATGRIGVRRGDKRHALRPSDDLRLGLRVLGASRLDEAAALEFEDRLRKDRLDLPVRGGLQDPDAAPDDPSPSVRARSRSGGPRRRGLDRADLEAARERAGKVLARLERWPRRAAVGVHLERFTTLRNGDLGWRTSDAAEARLAPVLEALGDELAGEEISFEEFARLVEARALSVAAPRLGGAGAGVAVLDAMSARGRTFDELFVLGLNRDVFPRSAREDPLLSDSLRGATSVILPDIPIKGRSRDEDRHLFAQLSSAAPEVTFSWQTLDADGKERVRSPLLDGLLSGEEEVVEAPPLFPLRHEQAFDKSPRTAFEAAILGGLFGGLAAGPARLALALAETGTPGARELAETRLALLGAMESGASHAGNHAPWLGFLGAPGAGSLTPDPIAEAPFITHIEGIARCPWQFALKRFLGLEPAKDPLEALPGIDKRVLGNIVHGVLERIALGALGERDEALDAALGQPPVRVPWPDPGDLDALLEEIAAFHLAREGLGQPGVLRMLKVVAMPYLERAHELLEEELRGVEQGGCLGVELAGLARVPMPAGGEAAVRFKVDRVDRLDDTLLLSDFKTGKALSTRDLQKKLPEGANLQPAAYILGVDGEDAKVRGRLVFLNPEVEREKARVELRAEKKEPLADFGEALEGVLEGWQDGTFFPRLERADKDVEPDACRYCDFSSACVRGDSGARRNLVELAQTHGKEPEFAALRRLWFLGHEPADAEETP